MANKARNSPSRQVRKSQGAATRVAKAKAAKRKFDPKVEGDANDHLLGELEGWDSAVIKTASHFTVCKMRGPSRSERRTIVYRTFPEAHEIAYADPQALIYAITPEGRSCCVPRSIYNDVMVMWREQHPTDIAPNVFKTTDTPEWYSYAHGCTTGPWPDDTQAVLVGMLLSSLQLWDRYTDAERISVRHAVSRLNEKLEKEQGRVPVTLPGA